MLGTILAGLILLLLPAVLVFHRVVEGRRKTELKEISELLTSRRLLLDSLHERLDAQAKVRTVQQQQLLRFGNLLRRLKGRDVPPLDVVVHLRIAAPGDAKLKEVLSKRFLVEDWFDKSPRTWISEPQLETGRITARWDDRWGRKGQPSTGVTFSEVTH